MKPGIQTYLIVSFAIAWLCWGLCWFIINHPLNLSLTLFLIIGSFGPFIAAGLCSWLSGGLGATLRFYARGLNPFMGWKVFLTAFFLVPILAIISAAIYARQMHQIFAFQMSWSDLPMAYLWLFFLGGPVGEEFGWSYLSDQLDKKFNLNFSNLLLGTIWGFWHLPLFFLIVPGLTQHYMPFDAFLAFSISARFLFSWAYHKSNRNILSNLIFHNALNFSLSIVVIVVPAVGQDHLRLWYLTALSAISAFALQRASPNDQTSYSAASVHSEKGR